MLFDDLECLHDVDCAHLCDATNRLPPTRRGELDHYLATSLPYVYVWRLVLTRREVNDDAKAIDSKDGRHAQV